MSEAQLIKPDLGYVKEVMNAGGESLKKCYQCATCSVVCEIAPDGKPFPRKEMVLAQWGQKEKLVNNPDVWLCHECSDCSAKCPRDAKPGEVLGAIRKTGYAHFAFPHFMGALFSDIKYLPVLFAIPAVILFAVISILGSFSPERGSEGQIIFSKFFGEFHFLFDKPISAIDLVFVPIAMIVAFSAFVSLKEFWSGMDSQVDPSVPRKGFGAAVGEFVGEIISHATFKKCVSSASRSTAHMLVFYGFIGLFITTSFAAMFEWGHILLGWHTTSPLPFNSYGLLPKIIGNTSGGALIVGGLLMIKNRMGNEDNPASSYDWVFLGVVFLVGLTGFLAQFARLAGMDLAYSIYFVHLVFVFYIIAYLPFSKLAHLLYRSTAIIYAKNIGRETMAVAAPAAVVEAAPAAETAAEDKKEEPQA